MAEKEKQHYYPRSLMKNYMGGGKQIWAFNKFDQSIREVGTADVAAGKRFYNLPSSSPNNRKLIENIFGDLEARQMPLIRKVQQRVHSAFYLSSKGAYKHDIISDDEKVDLSTIVAIQNLRTQSARNIFKETSQAFAPLIKQYEFEPIINELIRNANQKFNLDDEELVGFRDYASELFDLITEQHELMHIKAIFEGWESISTAIRDFIWVLGINNTNESFYTSDHPVANRNHLDSGGIITPGSEIAFPISKKLILIMRERSHFKNLIHFDKKLVRMSLEDVSDYNTMQVLKSHMFVFNSSDNFDLAKQICKDHPEICKKDRKLLRFREHDQKQAD
jgi:hypothetical protein